MARPSVGCHIGAVRVGNRGDTSSYCSTQGASGESICQPKTDLQSFVFGGVVNETGWSSPVIAWLLGLLQSAFAYLGFDLVYHVSEEMRDPRKQAPRAVNWTIIISAVSGMAVLLAMLFCISDLETTLSTRYG
jgi:choline transport protein